MSIYSYNINLVFYIMNPKITCITNIYNEEYLLPFWLNHHKSIFDNIIILDHQSNDKSLEICKNIVPNCKIIKHPHNKFDIKEHDILLMKLEREISGIKIILNTTEFLFTTKPIRHFFKSSKKSLQILCYSPYSLNEYYPKNNYDLLLNLKNEDVKFHHDREGGRYIHNYPDGKYVIGRHMTYNRFDKTDEMFIIWFGYYPMNNMLLNRKLQIKKKIPESDRNPKPGFPNGFGWQHFFEKQTMININKNKGTNGNSLKKFNISIFTLLLKYILDLNCNPPQEKTCLSNFYK